MLFIILMLLLWALMAFQVSIDRFGWLWLVGFAWFFGFLDSRMMLRWDKQESRLPRDMDPDNPQDMGFNRELFEESR